MSEYFVFPGQDVVGDEANPRKSMEYYNIHAGSLAGGVLMGLQEKASGSWSLSKVNRDPGKYIAHSESVARSSPISLHRHMRNVLEICGQADMSVPARTARLLQGVNYSEVIDLMQVQHADAASRETDNMLSILAEEGETDVYYEHDHTALRKWIEQVANHVRDEVIRHFTNGSQDPDAIAKAKEQPEDIARIFLATSVALAEIDVHLQEAIGEKGHDTNSLGFSVLGVVYNEIRDSILAHVLTGVAGWWKEGFELEPIRDKLNQYSANIDELRPKRITPRSGREEAFRNALVQRLPLGAKSAVRAGRVLNEMFALPVVARTLQQTSLYEEGARAPAGDTYYPNGLVSGFFPEGDTLSMHYSVDGPKRRQTIGVYNPAATDTHIYSAMYPLGSPFYAVRNFSEFHLSYDGHAFPFSSNQLAPQMPFDDIEQFEDALRTVAKALNMRMAERSQQYRELFERTPEISPLIFADKPGDEVILCPGGDQLEFEIPPLVGETRVLRQDIGIAALVRSGGAVESGSQWLAVSQPELEKKLRVKEREESAFASDEGEASSATEPERSAAEEQARIRRELRRFVAPTLQDLLRILADTEEVSNVVHQPKSGKGSGSHQEIIVLHTDGHVSRQDTWAKIQRRNASIKWATLFRMLSAEKLGIPLESFFRAVQSGEHLRMVGKSGHEKD